LTENYFPIQAPGEIVRGFLILDWQSTATTALSRGQPAGLIIPKRRRAPLAAAVQNFSSPGNFENAL
jgi:hypothetical protein